MQIILASQSPRRRQLLELCGLSFSVRTAPCEEASISRKLRAQTAHLDAYRQADHLTKTLSREKALSVFRSFPSDVVIGADTVVVSGDRILEKPRDSKEAEEMLLSLCGITHRVYTGVTLLAPSYDHTFSSFATVEFFKDSPAMRHIICAYLRSGSPMDKAGAYGIQDFGSLMVKSIQGDFYTVVGLPVGLLYQKLLEIPQIHLQTDLQRR